MLLAKRFPSLSLRLPAAGPKPTLCQALAAGSPLPQPGPSSVPEHRGRALQIT